MIIIMSLARVIEKRLHVMREIAELHIAIMATHYCSGK